MITIDMQVTLTTAQLNAWATIRPALKAYARKVWRVYRHASHDQQAALLAHNPMLAALVDVLGND